MNKRRLLKLADFLETVPRKSFDIGVWEDRPATKPEGRKQGERGFAGCAIGWAVHAKLFRGLSFADRPHWWHRSETYKVPTYNGHESYGACASLMGLPEGDDDESPADAVQHLFCPDAYPEDAEGSSTATPKQVARRIRAFVKSNGAIR